MQVILEDHPHFLLRFDPGEQVFPLLQQFCGEKQITAGSFQGIGACASITLSYYNLETKAYEDSQITQDTEITSLLGNIAQMNDELIIHAHGTVANQALEVRGGHVKEIVVSATCEITLTKLTGVVQRAYDETTGLNLLV